LSSREEKLPRASAEVER